jgi:hypothetical protein
MQDAKSSGLPYLDELYLDLFGYEESLRSSLPPHTGVPLEGIPAAPPDSDGKSLVSTPFAKMCSDAPLDWDDKSSTPISSSMQQKHEYRAKMCPNAPPEQMDFYWRGTARDVAAAIRMDAEMKKQRQPTEPHYARPTNEDEQGLSRERYHARLNTEHEKRPARCYKCNSAKNMLPGRTFCTSKECVADRAAGDAECNLD